MKNLKVFLGLFVAFFVIASQLPISPITAAQAGSGGTGAVYLPLLQGHAVPAAGPLVNTPFFEGDIRYAETAVFWFGQVTRSSNYADLRMGYNASELYIDLSIVDRRLWYDTTPAAAELTAWDAVSVFLQLNPDAGGTIYRFDAQLSFWEQQAAYRAAYRLEGTSWVPVDFPLNTKTGWRGTGPNTETDDRGWVATFRLPFAGFGLNTPSKGTQWRIAVQVHDRDGLNEPSQPVLPWPQDFKLGQPSSWARLGFGTPTYSAPPVSSTQTVTIRNKLNGAVVVDGEVGGGSVCGDGLDFWTQWGPAVYPGHQDNSDFNIQNQGDIADWPCFARYYLTFPLSALPHGMKIVSARLVMHQMGSSGGAGYEDPALPSYIQVFRVGHDWQENTLSWNNSPQAYENVSGAWVDPVSVFPGWPGIPWAWDVSRAVAESYADGTPIRLAFYSADGAYHSGKYFVSSDTGDWNEKARPTLEVVLGPAR